jgi:flagellar biosynthesis protein FlhA
VDRVKADSPALVEDVVPKLLPLSTVTSLLQNLLDEEVSIRDMRRILDVLAVHGAQTQDLHELTALVRVTLGRAIVQHWYGSAPQLEVMTLDAQLEQMLMQALTNGGGMEPGLADTLVEQVETSTARQEERGLAPVLVVQHELRPLLTRFLRRRMRRLVVLSQNEIPDDRSVRVNMLIGGR